MKKHLLLLSFLTVGFLGLQAQITITSADVAAPVHVIYQAHDTLPTVTEGAAGTSQVWNMAALHTHTIDTLTFIPYAWAPDPSFSASNLVAQQGTGNAYSYLINATPQLVALGFKGTFDLAGSPVTIKQINTPAEKLVTYPFTYSSNFVNDFLSMTPPTYVNLTVGPGFVMDSIRTRSAVHKTVVCDGWGTLTTPLGTYNVIRNKETKVKHDTSDAYIAILGGWQNGADIKADSTTEYTFWANAVGFPLVTITKDSSNAVVSAQWLMATPTVGITEFTAPVTVNAYPNPAQTEINLTIDPAIAIAVQVYDMMGRLVGSYPVTSSITSISTANFANGAYSFTIISPANEIVSRGKFNVAN